jgi:transposase InsO family protein
MPKLIGHKLYLMVDDLTAAQVSEKHIKDALYRNRQQTFTSWAHIYDEADGRKVLIDYDTIPADTASKLQSKAHYVQLARHTALRHAFKINDEALKYYLQQPQAQTKAHQYTRLAAWAALLGPLTKGQAHKMGFESLDQLYHIALPLLNEECQEVVKITNVASLIRKIKPFKDCLKPDFNLASACESLINRRNTNRDCYKLGQAQQDLLIHLYSSPRKLNYEQVFVAYTNKAYELVQSGAWDRKTLVSMGTVKEYLYRPAIRQLCEVKRHSYTEVRSKYDHIIKRQAASFANAKWVIDGTPWHRYYLVDGNAYARLNVFVVLDEYSWCVIGFCASFNENSDQVVKALAGACQRTGYAPYQLQYDNSSAINSYHSQHVIEKLTQYNVSTQVGNARAKVVEPFFKHFNDRILKFETGYTGSPFMSKRMDGHANKEEIALQIKQGKIATKEQAITDLMAEFNLWNSQPFRGDKSPLELYRSSVADSHDRQRTFDHYMMVDAFWEMPGKMVKEKREVDGKVRQLQRFVPQLYTFNNWGIRIERSGKTYDFDIEEPDFWRQHWGKRFAVKYDPDTIDTIYLFDEQGRPLNHNGNMAKLTNKTVLHSAMVDHAPGEMGKVQELNKLRKLHRMSIEADYADVIDRTKEEGSYLEVNAEAVYGKEAINRAKMLRWEAQLPPVNEQLPETTTTDETTDKTTYKPSKRWEL